MRSSHHEEEGLEIWGIQGRAAKKKVLTIGEKFKSRGREQFVEAYLQPAADSLSAYILPMSPMPIKPTTKSCIPSGMPEDGVVMIAAATQREQSRMQ